MNSILDFENVREQVSYIGEAVTMYDELTKKVMEARFNYRMLALNPDRGIGMDRQTGKPVRTTPDEMAKNVEFLAKEREDIAKIIFEVTGATTMDGARQAYLDILSAYQRVGGLREMYKLVRAGFRKAIEEAATNEGIIQPSEFEPLIDQSAQKLAEVVATLPEFNLTQVQTALITRPGIITLQ